MSEREIRRDALVTRKAGRLTYGKDAFVRGGERVRRDASPTAKMLLFAEGRGQGGTPHLRQRCFSSRRGEGKAGRLTYFWLKNVMEKAFPESFAFI
jgi:hypothetical protein